MWPCSWAARWWRSRSSRRPDPHPKEDARVETLQKETGQVIPWTFAQETGRSAGDFKRAWATACIKAGFFRVVERTRLNAEGKPETVPVKVPTMLFHDFRRTAVRTLVRAGIPETTAMAMTGHRTRAVFKRYAIVDEGMLREAGEKLVARLVQPADSKVETERGKVRAIKA